MYFCGELPCSSLPGLLRRHTRRNKTSVIGCRDQTWATPTVLNRAFVVANANIKHVVAPRSKNRRKYRISNNVFYDMSTEKSPGDMSTTTSNSAPTRVGIDFGGTIGLIEDSKPAPYAFEMIAHLVAKFAPENVFIVSKAGPSMEAKIKAWLEQQDFYGETAFLYDNVIFVRKYLDKAEVVQKLNISIFFDDNTRIVKSLAPLPVVQRIFWMHADRHDIKAIPRHLRSKIAITHQWAKTMPYFQRIPRGEEEEEE